MRIESIHIRQFEGLHDYDHSFAQPFSLFYGENETGKTTIMRFIRMMLYGGGTTLRNECRPLSGDAMGGTITFEAEGKRYQLDRSFGKTRRTDRIRLTNLASGESCALSAGTEPGEMFLGLGEDAFVRSCFVGTLGSISGEKGSEEIRQKLQNLVSTGAEAVSVTEVENRLNTAARTIRNKTQTQGLLVEKSQKLSELRASWEEAKAFEQTRRERSLQQDALQTEIAECTEQLKRLKLYHKQRAQQRSDSLYRRAGQLEQRLTADGEMASRSLIASFQREAEDILAKEQLLVRDEDKNELMQQYQKQQENLDAQKAYYAALEHSQKQAACRTRETKEQYAQYLYQHRKPIPLYLLGGAGLLLLAAILLFFAVSKTAGIGLAVCSVILFAAALWMQLSWRRRGEQLRKENIAAEQQESELSVRLSEQQLRLCSSEGTLHELSTRIQQTEKQQALRSELDQRKAILYRRLKAYGLNDWAQVQSFLDELMQCCDEWNLLQGKLGTLAASQTSDEERQLQQRLHQLQLDAAELSGALKTSSIPVSAAQLENRMQYLESEIAVLQTEYDALQLAIEVINESFTEMQQQFGAILCGQTMQYLSALTGGKYDYVTVDRNLRLQTRNASGMLTPDTLLSGGTADQSYLALRLAITRLMAKSSGSSLPLFLDDSFIQYDDRRCAAAMRLIASLTDTPEFSQAVLFTCHNREKDLYQNIRK